MRSQLLFALFYSFLIIGASAFSATDLPKSINIVSGIPLTIPTENLESMGLKPNENTGGWGDVMSNVTMALELKKQFPDIVVRLIVTLNDHDTRPFVNKVRTFIPKIMKNERNEVYLDPDIKTKQLYQGLEIYFASVPGSFGMVDPKNMMEAQINEIKAAVSEVPKADLGLQYSANNSVYTRLVNKSEKMHIYFEEYSSNKESHAMSVFQSGIPQIKIYSGPLSFGVYGFGTNDDGHNSLTNTDIVHKWLSHLALTNPVLAEYSNMKLSDLNLAFAYAGDSELIEDYVKAVDRLAKQSSRPTVIVYKGSGPIRKIRNRILIPLEAHPKELAHALISESTYSPLITGDGSLSSAMETTSATKSFLCENNEWKLQAMTALIATAFKSKPELMESALGLLVPTTKELKQKKLSRKARVELIQTALKNEAVHSQMHSYLSRNRAALNIADNTINMYQFRSIFETIQNGISKGLMYSDTYLAWLTQLTKSFSVAAGLPYEQLRNQLDDSVYGKSRQLLEKWYALFTLWEMDQSVDRAQIKIVLAETAQFFKQKETMAKFDNETQLRQMLDQVNMSAKSKFALYEGLKQDRAAMDDFRFIREKYNEQSSRKLLLVRQNSCVRVYTK